MKNKILLMTVAISFIAINCMAQVGSKPLTVTDADGNVYSTVKIGNQVWTVENLRTTKYNDGTPIPLVKDSSAWVALKTPGYCYYNNTSNAGIIKKNGALYNWYVVNTDKLAPKGWHVPTDEEWTQLETYLVLKGYNWDGTTDASQNNNIAKSLASKSAWNLYNPNQDANKEELKGQIGNDLTKNNRSGFSALPGGYRNFNGFHNQGSEGYWWSSDDKNSNAYFRSLYYDSDNLVTDYYPKSCGFSVRLLKDI